MFIDASALTAIILLEPEANALADRLGAASAPITSAIAMYEAVLAVARAANLDVPVALAEVRETLTSAGIQIIDIGSAEADAALDAHHRFGKGRHPARLNLGDCFAYACARTHRVPLLFKGDEFGLTDIEAA